MNNVQILISAFNCACREHFIAESVYRDHPTLSIFQCRWSPIRSAKIVMVLNSDSFLRYDYFNGLMEKKTEHNMELYY